MLNESKIMVTRNKSQADSFSQQISLHGGIPIEVPLLDINCRFNKTTSYLDDLAGYTWIFFTSVNGVHCFFKQNQLTDMSSNLLRRVNFAVVGQKTGEALQSYGYSVHFMPPMYNAKSMADTFTATYPTAQHILIVQGSQSRPVLRERLQAHYRFVQCVTVYDTVTNQGVQQLLNETIQSQIDFITFTSPSTIDAFINLLDGPIDQEVVYVCIGTTTEKRAHERGLYHTLTPERFTTEDMITCMANYIKEEGV